MISRTTARSKRSKSAAVEPSLDALCDASDDIQGRFYVLADATDALGQMMTLSMCGGITGKGDGPGNVARLMNQASAIVELLAREAQALARKHDEVSSQLTSQLARAGGR
jgi:hypothetical protein